MAVGSSENKITYEITYGDSPWTLTFPYPFFAREDLEVTCIMGSTEMLLVLDTDYTVQPLFGTYENGGLVIVSNPNLGVQITIRRVLAMLQETDYQDYSNFPASVFEGDLDKSVMRDQQLSERLDRTISAPKTDPDGLNYELPYWGERALQILGFNADGEVIACQPSEVPISSWAQYLVDDADADEARETMMVGVETWSPYKDYGVDDLVSYLGRFYMCNIENTGYDPTAYPDRWRPLIEADQIDLVSGYTSALGDVMELISDGTDVWARKADHYTNTGFSGNTLRQRVCKLAGEPFKFVLLYAQGLVIYAMVGTISPNDLSISWGTAVTVYTCTTTLCNVCGVGLDATHVLVAYHTTGNAANQTAAVCLTVSGTTITVNTPVNGPAAGCNLGLAKISDTRALMSYYSAVTTLGAVYVDISGTTVSFGTPATQTVATVTTLAEADNQETHPIVLDTWPSGNESYLVGYRAASAGFYRFVPFYKNVTTLTAGADFASSWAPTAPGSDEACQWENAPGGHPVIFAVAGGTAGSAQGLINHLRRTAEITFSTTGAGIGYCTPNMLPTTACAPRFTRIDDSNFLYAAVVGFTAVGGQASISLNLLRSRSAPNQMCQIDWELYDAVTWNGGFTATKWNTSVIKMDKSDLVVMAHAADTASTGQGGCLVVSPRNKLLGVCIAAGTGVFQRYGKAKLSGLTVGAAYTMDEDGALKVGPGRRIGLALSTTELLLQLEQDR